MAKAEAFCWGDLVRLLEAVHLPLGGVAEPGQLAVVVSAHVHGPGGRVEVMTLGGPVIVQASVLEMDEAGWIHKVTGRKPWV